MQALSRRIQVYDPTGRFIPVDLATKNTTETQKHLFEAWRLGEAPTCLCVWVERARPPLVLRNRKDYIIVAIHPNTGHLHRPECWFYRSKPSQSGLQGYSERVIVEEEGIKTVQLEISLNKNSPNFASGEGSALPETITKDSARGGRRPRMTTLGLLHLLWETARLNHFYANGRERSWFPVALKITGVAKEIKVGRSFIGDQLVILTPGGRERDFNSVAKVLEPFQKPTYQRKHRLLVLGEIARLDYQGRKIRLVDDDRYNVWLHSTDADLADLEPLCSSSSDARLIGLFVVDVTGLYQSKTEGRSPCCRTVVLFKAVMQTTLDFCPFESSFEQIIAEKLIDENRSFTKPLRYDAARDTVFPDFLLHDAGIRDYPLEVYGMASEQYLVRRAEKQAYYEREFGGNYWCWFAAGPDATAEPPPFPTARIKE